MPDSDPSVTFRQLTEIADLVVTGELSLQGSGRIVTSAATGTKRIIITSTASDRIILYTSAAETPGAIQAYDAGNEHYISVAGPENARTDQHSPRFYLKSSTGVGEILIDADDVSPYSTGGAYNDLGTVARPWHDLHLAGNVKGAAAAPTTFDPNLGILTGTTTPSVGTGANALESGAYTQMGAQVIGHFTLRWSSNGSSGNGTYKIDLPKRPATTLPLNPSVGSGRIFTSTGNREWLCDIRHNSSKKAIFRMGTTGGLNVTDNVPPIWVNSSDNRITGHLSYLTTE